MLTALNNAEYSAYHESWVGSSSLTRAAFIVTKLTTSTIGFLTWIAELPLQIPARSLSYFAYNKSWVLPSGTIHLSASIYANNGVKLVMA
jgi:hypothetical protein